MSLQTGQGTQKYGLGSVGTVHTGRAGKLALLPTQHQKESILLQASWGHHCTPVSASLHDSCCSLNTSPAPVSAIHAAHHYAVILTAGGSFLLLYPLYRWKKWNPRHNIAGRHPSYWLQSLNIILLPGTSTWINCWDSPRPSCHGVPAWPQANLPSPLQTQDWTLDSRPLLVNLHRTGRFGALFRLNHCWSATLDLFSRPCTSVSSSIKQDDHIRITNILLINFLPVNCCQVQKVGPGSEPVLDDAHVLKLYLKNLSFSTPLLRINIISGKSWNILPNQQTAGTGGQLKSFKHQVHC